jgi:hypothetical protein
MTVLQGNLLEGFERYGEAIHLYESYLQKYPNEKLFYHFIEEIKKASGI